MREETFARQKSLGVIPKDAKLAPRPEDIVAWEEHTRHEARVDCHMPGKSCRNQRRIPSPQRLSDIRHT
jgi:hypothetical protein